MYLQKRSFLSLSIKQVEGGSISVSTRSTLMLQFLSNLLGLQANSIQMTDSTESWLNSENSEKNHAVGARRTEFVKNRESSITRQKEKGSQEMLL